MSIVHQSLVQWRCIRWFHIWRKTFHEPHIYLRVSQLDGDWWTCPRRTTRQLNTEPLAKWGLGGYLGITKSQETVENCVDAGRDNKTVIGSHEAWLQQWWWDRWYEWLTPLLALYLGHGLRLEWGWNLWRFSRTLCHFQLPTRQWQEYNERPLSSGNSLRESQQTAPQKLVLTVNGFV